MLTWSELPDPILVDVFLRLTVKELASAAKVCSKWGQVAKDNVLWKYRIKKDFKLKRVPDGDSHTWRSEYENLVDRVPRVEVDVLRGHTDEVLHVAFSNHGDNIVSCSKDHQMLVWRWSGRTFTSCYRHDMGQFDWNHTWAAQFSPDDSKLMVAGVCNDVGGELAIFSTGRGTTETFTFLCRVVNDPYDVLGCWLDDQLFLSGTMSTDHLADLEASIWLCAPPDKPDPVVNLSHMLENQQPHQLLNLTCYKGLLYRFKNMRGNIYLRYLRCHSRRRFRTTEMEEKLWEKTKENNIQDEMAEVEQNIDDVRCESAFAEGDLCLIFLCGDKTWIPHQLGFQRLSPSCLRHPPALSEPEKVLEFSGHVIGLCLSRDGLQLFVNVRAWPGGAVPSVDTPPPIASQIEMHVVDLKTMEKTGQVFHGHLGLTPTERAFYLYLDVTENLVASGSENCKGYIWHRHLGAQVSTLQHSKCVNCVAINPNDEEVCVTASDDNTLKVWVSRNMVRKWKTE